MKTKLTKEFNLKSSWSLLKIMLFSCFSLLAYGQDTIKREASIKFSSIEFPVKSKRFISKVRYAREDIVYNPNKNRIEFCYYYDQKRICLGESYQIIKDSIILIYSSFSDSVFQEWSYSKIEENKYFVRRKYGQFHETGFVDSLLPFSKIGKFVTKLKGSPDTLWVCDYSKNQKQHLNSPIYSFPKSKIEGRVYLNSEVDQVPIYLGKPLISKIAIPRTHYYFGEPKIEIRTLTFIVSKKGEIKNIEQFEGNIDLQSQPHYFMELMKQILSKGKIIPGKVDGQNVNVRCYVNIDMMENRQNKN